MNHRRPRRPPDETNEIGPAEAIECDSLGQAAARIDAGLSDDRAFDGASFALGEGDSLLRPISSGCFAVKVDDPLWEVVLRQSWLDAFADSTVPLLRWRRAAFAADLVDALGAHPAAIVCVEYTQADAKRILDLLSLMKRDYPRARCVVIGSRRWASREWGLRRAGATACCWSPRQAGALCGLWIRHARLSPVLNLSPWKRLIARMPWALPDDAASGRRRTVADRPDGPSSAD